jgi:hypothetical protein
LNLEKYKFLNQKFKTNSDIEILEVNNSIEFNNEKLKINEINKNFLLAKLGKK